MIALIAAATEQRAATALPSFSATGLRTFNALGGSGARVRPCQVDATAEHGGAGAASVANGTPTTYEDADGVAWVELIDSCLAMGYEFGSPPGGAASWTLQFWYDPVSPDLSSGTTAVLACSDYIWTGGRQWFVEGFTSGANQYVGLEIWEGGGGGLQTTNVNLGPSGLASGGPRLISVVYDSVTQVVTLYVDATPCASPITGFTGIVTSAAPGNRSPVLVGQTFDAFVGADGSYVKSANGRFCGWTVFDSAKDSGFIAARHAAGPRAVPTTVTNPLVVNEPAPGMVQPFQPGTGQGTFHLSGFNVPRVGVTPPTDILYRYPAGTGSFVAASVTWDGPAFYAEIGPFDMGPVADIEFAWDTDPSVTVTVPAVGIGVVILDRGDSNMSGAGTNDQTYYPTSGRASFLSYDYGVHDCIDKKGRPGLYRWNDWGSNGSGGSIAPLLAKLIVDNHNVGVLWVPSARAVSDTRQMVPGYNGISFQERTGPDNSLLGRRAMLTGVVKAHACIFWSTPNDINAGLTATQFGDNLDLIAAATVADFGCKVLAHVCHNTGQTGLAAYQSEVTARAVATPANYLTPSSLTDIPSPANIHVTSDANLQVIADRDYATLAAALFPDATSNMLFEDGDVMLFEDADAMVYEG